VVLDNAEGRLKDENLRAILEVRTYVTGYAALKRPPTVQTVAGVTSGGGTTLLHQPEYTMHLHPCNLSAAVVSLCSCVTATHP
jgi:hypothetical protein